MACFQNQLRRLENGALSNSSRVQPFHSCILEEFDGARNMSLDVAKFYSTNETCTRAEPTTSMLLTY